MRANTLKRLILQECNIEAEGCLHLAKSNWSQLSKISLCNNINKKAKNPIGEEGIGHIAKANWDITDLHLCKEYVS